MQTSSRALLPTPVPLKFTTEITEQLLQPAPPPSPSLSRHCGLGGWSPKLQEGPGRKRSQTWDPQSQYKRLAASLGGSFQERLCKAFLRQAGQARPLVLRAQRWAGSWLFLLHEEGPEPTGGLLWALTTTPSRCRWSLLLNMRVFS